MSDVEQAKRAMTHKIPEKVLKNSDFLSTGLTLGNLAAYGRTHGGFVKGRIYRIIGKSQTSKTFLVKTILAEAAASPNFSDYLLIHDDIEKGGDLINTEKFFGKLLLNRLQAPAYDKQKRPIYSRSTDEFYERINALLDKGKKLIWVPDSLDALTGEETKMGDGKAKKHSQELRRLLHGLEDTGSIVILVQHAKVNMGLTWGSSLVTTGGASPEFYSTLDIWLSKMGTIKRSHKKSGKEYPIGVTIRAHIKKNRVSGVDREFEFPLFYDYGVDDIGSCVEWLIENGHWNREKGRLIAPEFKFTGHTNKLIRKIEDDGSKRELQILTGKVWKEIDDSLTLKRKPRFA